MSLDRVAERFADKGAARRYNSMLRRSRSEIMRSVTGLIWHPDEFSINQVCKAAETLVEVLNEIDPAEQVTRSYVKDSFLKGHNLYIDYAGVLQELKPRPELKAMAVPDDIQSILRLDRYDLWNLHPDQIVRVDANRLMVDPEVLSLIQKVKLCKRLTKRECELINMPNLFSESNNDSREILWARALTIMLHERANK